MLSGYYFIYPYCSVYTAASPTKPCVWTPELTQTWVMSPPHLLAPCPLNALKKKSLLAMVVHLSTWKTKAGSWISDIQGQPGL